MPMPTRRQAEYIRDGIAETHRMIAREESYSRDLQKVVYLRSLYTQLHKLEVMLKTGQGLPVVC